MQSGNQPRPCYFQAILLMSIGVPACWLPMNFLARPQTQLKIV
eukprot:jgi/Botrbrau1/15658/Bobra.4_1s0042.1